MGSRKPSLYQYEVCPFCWKVKAALAYKKVDYKTVEVHPLNKKEISFSSSYKKVPIYVDSEGRQVNDSTPIMRHIDREFKGPSFVPSDSSKQAEDKKFLEWSDRYVKVLPPLIYQNFGDALKAFDYITNVGSFSWFQKRTIKYSGAAVMTMVAKKSAKRQEIENPTEHFLNKLEEFEKMLGESPFLGGDKPMTADLSIFGVTMSLLNLPAFDLISEKKSFHSWMERVSERTGLSMQSKSQA